MNVCCSSPFSYYLFVLTKFRYAITFDGWTNNSLKLFYPVTLHFVCFESTKPASVLLDFLDVFLGDGVRKRCCSVFRTLCEKY